MDKLFRVIFGLALLAVPLVIAVTAILLLAVSIPLIPVILPVTTTCAVIAVLVLYLRWRKREKTA